jgi:hypothetical protein
MIEGRCTAPRTKCSRSAGSTSSGVSAESVNHFTYAEKELAAEADAGRAGGGSVAPGAGDTLMDIARTNGVARTHRSLPCSERRRGRTPKRCERQTPTPNVNAFTYAARLHQHKCFTAARNERTSVLCERQSRRGAIAMEYYAVAVVALYMDRRPLTVAAISVVSFRRSGIKRPRQWPFW